VKATPPFDRLMRKVCAQPDGCLLFTGYLTEDGYGRVKAQGEAVYVHRVVYEKTIGPIPPGMEVDHVCRTRNCVKPEHLALISRSDHGKQGMATRWGTH
jgi:hypothetical protein